MNICLSKESIVFSSWSLTVTSYKNGIYRHFQDFGKSGQICRKHVVK